MYAGNVSQTSVLVYYKPDWPYSNDPGHMTKMAAMPIYGKTIEDIFLWSRNADYLETWYTALSTRVLPSFFFFK